MSRVLSGLCLTHKRLIISSKQTCRYSTMIKKKQHWYRIGIGCCSVFWVSESDCFWKNGISLFCGGRSIDKQCGEAFINIEIHIKARHIEGQGGPTILSLTPVMHAHGLVARESLPAPLLDLWGHQRACTGEETGLMRRSALCIWQDFIPFRCASSRAASPGCYRTSPLSHIHSCRGHGEGQRFKGWGGADNKGEAAVPSHSVYSAYVRNTGLNPNDYFLFPLYWLCLKKQQKDPPKTYFFLF